MNKSLLALFSFEVVDFANTSANLHLHENHNKNKRWQAMRLHFPDINGTKLKSEFEIGERFITTVCRISLLEEFSRLLLQVIIMYFKK